MTIEGIVRPFQSPRPLGTTRRVIPSARKEPPQTAGVTWGAAGTLPEPQESAVDQPAVLPGFNTKTVKRLTARNRETGREVEKVRVENPDDPNQYVIIERVKSIAFKDKDAPVLKSLPAAEGTTAFPVPTSPDPPDPRGKPWGPDKWVKPEETIWVFENPPGDR